MFNPETKDIVINEFEITDKKVVRGEVTTKFSMGVITGTKVTVTNNPTVLASSEITQEIIKKVNSVNVKFETTEVISTVTTLYPDQVKVVTLFKDVEKNEVTKVVSFFDKKTSEVKMVESDRVLSTINVAKIEKEVFSTAECIAAKKATPLSAPVFNLSRDDTQKL